MIKDKPLKKKIPVEKSDGHRVAIVQNLHYADHWKSIIMNIERS
jgi:hypothetical protein